MSSREFHIDTARMIIENNRHSLSNVAVDIFEGCVNESVEKTGKFIVAISGGSTPRDMYRMLAEEPYHSRVPWERIHFFWVDERCVSVDDPVSNYGTALKDLLDHVPIPRYQVHPMRGDLPPDEGREEYEGELRSFFNIAHDEVPVFDLVILGIGTDGHTASLFPGHDSLHATERLVCAVKGGNPDLNRLTLTIPVLNNARHVLFIVAGGEKASVVSKVFSGDGDGGDVPAGMVKPREGELIWLLDHDAASLVLRTLKKSAEMPHEAEWHEKEGR
ncbi:MAG TPA: 6-phosphogluconolactonase [Deltaproteobacteria bacterium]|nr:6-phosphogluconolactonase [Deltaproteobacteria bacterium]